MKRFVFTLALIIAMGVNAVAGELEPPGPPNSTMKTLNEIPPTWSQKLPAAERFVLVLDGAAVLDKETGLVWEQSPGTNTYSWLSSQIHCIDNTVANRKGWRLPSIEELSSLIDSTQSALALPSDHPFNNVQSSYYWSSTTHATNTDAAWVVYLNYGNANNLDKSSHYYVWCVRGGPN